MSKTPLAGVVLGLLIFTAAASSAAAVGVHSATEEAAPTTGSFKDAVTAGDTERPPMDFTETGSKAADLPIDAVTAPPTAPLPLSQVGGAAKAPAAGGPFGLWDLVSQIRYGGLPEPASWTLMLIGFGMIGGALRGFMLANRRLAGLQPADSEDTENVAGDD